MKPGKPPIFQYVFLALLFVLAAGYQVRSVLHSFPGYFHREDAADPFLPNYEKGHPVAQFVGLSAQRVGVKRGDILLAVNGRPFRGLAVFGEAMRLARPGDSLTVDLLTPGDAQPRSATILLEPVDSPPFNWTGASVLFLKLVMPTFCILMGFWVAAVRPRDPSAWFLCLIMLFFSVFFWAGVESWGPVVRDLAGAYRAAVGTAWPIFMLLFGLYFPEPFPGKESLWLKWSKRIVISVLIVFSVLTVVVQLGELENFSAVASLAALLQRFGKLQFILSFAATGGFFAAISVKMHMAVTPDAKRRLRLLYFCSTISMGPACILFVVQAIKGSPFEGIFPLWLVLSSLSLMLFFPITLAYVIVVQRAMDVRVVIRQGLQYALATGGIRVLQILLTVIVVFSVVIFSRSHKLSLANEITTISLGVLAVIWLRKGGERVRQWTDRRFFRDAYNAEQILEALSEEVRSIVEKRPLLERVATKIAESLHIPRVAVLLEDGGAYRPAFALGYPGTLDADLPESSATIRHLKHAGPERVYFDDENSWVNQSASGLTDDERRKLVALEPQLLIPLSVKDKLLGIISLGQKRSEAPYSSTDIRLLKSVATQTALALSNAELTSAIADEIARREKLNREIEIAREVQERLFPQHLPPIVGLDYFGRCRTALAVGGDYYDFLALPEGKLGIALGDVSGKGIAAALTMASLQASLRSEALRAGDNLGAMIAQVNRMVYDASTEDRYATLFYAQYDPAARRLTYVNAGHCPPILLHNTPNGRVTERLDQAGGTVVGLLPEFDYQQAVVSLAPGDLLVIYTDGFSEAMSPALEEWGDQRLLAAVTSCDGLPSWDVITRVIAAADAFASGAPQSDDMTLVVLRAL